MAERNCVRFCNAVSLRRVFIKAAGCLTRTRVNEISKSASSLPSTLSLRYCLFISIRCKSLVDFIYFIVSRLVGSHSESDPTAKKFKNKQSAFIRIYVKIQNLAPSPTPDEALTALSLSYFTLLFGLQKTFWQHRSRSF